MEYHHLSNNIIATYSIAAFDPQEKEWGVAVQSKFFAVGTIVPWAQANAGVIVTQSIGNPLHGINGLQKLQAGQSATDVLNEFIDEDPMINSRQIGIIDASGNAVSYTGSNCITFASNKTGEHYTVQGNMLRNDCIIDQMGKTFERSTGTLAERMLKSLETAEELGGDQRGRQSAALIIVKEKGGYGGENDRYIDLRVDDHIHPIVELNRLYHLHQLYNTPSNEEEIIMINPSMEEMLRQCLKDLSYIRDEMKSILDYDEALHDFLLNENIAHRKSPIGKIDIKVYRHLLKKAKECKKI